MAVSEVEAAVYLSVIRRINQALAAREPGREDREIMWGEGGGLWWQGGLEMTLVSSGASPPCSGPTWC